MVTEHKQLRSALFIFYLVITCYHLYVLPYSHLHHNWPILLSSSYRYPGLTSPGHTLYFDAQPDHQRFTGESAAIPDTKISVANDSTMPETPNTMANDPDPSYDNCIIKNQHQRPCAHQRDDYYRQVGQTGLPTHHDEPHGGDPY